MTLLTKCIFEFLGTLVLIRAVGDKTGYHGEENAAEIVENLQVLQCLGIVVFGAEVGSPQGRAYIEQRGSQTQQHGHRRTPEKGLPIHAQYEETAEDKDGEEEDAAPFRADAVSYRAGKELAAYQHQSKERDHRGGQFGGVSFCAHQCGHVP